MPGKIDIFELVPPETLLDEKQQQSILYSSDEPSFRTMYSIAGCRLLRL